jgi:hypothetical protein
MKTRPLYWGCLAYRYVARSWRGGCEEGKEGREGGREGGRHVSEGHVYMKR